MQRAFLAAALSALSLTAQFARAQGYGPDMATPTVPADSGGSVVIAPQNNGSVLVTPANPGEQASPRAARSGVVSNAPSNGENTPTGPQGTNGILPDDAQVAFEQVPDIHL